jgi:hypothetical protein
MATDCPAHSGGEMSEPAEVEDWEIPANYGEVSSGSDQAGFRAASWRCKLFPSKEMRQELGGLAAGTIAKSIGKARTFSRSNTT